MITSEQLERSYFDSNPYRSNLSLKGTSFRSAVSKIASKIPYMKTLSMLASETYENISLEFAGNESVIIGIKWISCRALMKFHIISIDPPAMMLIAVTAENETINEFDAASPTAATSARPGIFSM